MSDRPRSAPIVEAIVDLATGAVAGLVVGIGGARLLRATNRWGWETASGSRIAVLALPVLAYAIGDGLGGNGFVAAYVAGIAAGSIGADLVTGSGRAAWRASCSGSSRSRSWSAQACTRPPTSSWT